MDQLITTETFTAARRTIAPGLIAGADAMRPSLARGLEAAEYCLAHPLIARGLADAKPCIAHHAATPAAPRIARADRPAQAFALPSDGARKAAFTLRLDAVRHALLREACAATQRSAQLLVTEALDAFLADPRRIGAPLSAGGLNP